MVARQELGLAMPEHKVKFNNTISFLEEASLVDVEHKTHIPKRANVQTQEMWERAFEIIGLYYGTDNSLEEIASAYNLRVGQARQIIYRAVKALHRVSEQGLKDKYPIEKLGYSKKGPHVGRTPIFERLIDPDLPDKTVQRILNRMNRQTYQRLREKPNSLVVSVTEVAREAGLFFTFRDVSMLAAKHRVERRKDGKRVRKDYYFISSAQKDRAIKIFKNHSEAKQFMWPTVVVLGKPSEVVPTTGDLREEPYMHLMDLVRTIWGTKIKFPSHGGFYQLILDDCPASVYVAVSDYNKTFYNTHEEELLIPYLKKRLSELGY